MLRRGALAPMNGGGAAARGEVSPPICDKYRGIPLEKRRRQARVPLPLLWRLALVLPLAHGGSGEALTPGHPANTAAPEAETGLEGHWRITWTRPGRWWPKTFTGELALWRREGGWASSLGFEETAGTFRPSSSAAEAGGLKLGFRVGEDTFELNVRRLGDGLVGEAQWVGSIDWSPVAGTRVTPAPADLTGVALRPFVTGLPAAPNPLPLRSAFKERWRRPPILSEDGQRVWMTDDRDLWTGDADHPDQSSKLGKAPTTPDWWASDPVGDRLFLAAKGRIWTLARDGSASTIAEDLGLIDWVEPRWSEGRLVVATHGERLRVLDVNLAGGEYTELYSHPTADDVVFDANWKPRFLLDRTWKHFGTGVSANMLTLQDPEGRMLGSLVRQPEWVSDRDPVPRAGRGPVYLLGGGDLVTVGTLGKRGFEAKPTASAWGDATTLLVDPQTGALDAVGWRAERLHWDVLTSDGKELTWLQDKLAADVSVRQRVAGDRRWLVMSWSGSFPTRYWRFDRDDRSLVELVAPGDADERTWHPVQAAVVTARDGLKLAAFVTRPEGAGPWPLIVTVHGGPWHGHHQWSVDKSAQAWAERGYATLAVNFRGTRGFGWKLMESSEFGGDGMIHDVEDGIGWAIAEGVADPTRIAMEGVSYGGYAALRFATAERPLVKCAVAGLERGNLTVPGGGLNIEAVRDLAWREAHSPDRFTERLTGPVLVWNGGRDGENADAIQDFVLRAEAAGKAVTWVRFPWEEHGLTTAANRAAIDVIADRFLGACLGGPSAAFSDDLADAELEVRAGAAHVPGLAERVR